MKLKFYKFLIFLQNIDRKILYVVVAVIISIPLILMPNYHPNYVFDEVKNAYNIIDCIDKNKIVFISTVYSGSTEAENGEQLRVILSHIFRNNNKCVIIAWDTAGDKLTYDLATSVAQKYNKKYGEDWVHLGYRIPNFQTLLRGFGTDFISTFKTDRNGNKLIDLPLTSKVKNAKDVGAVCEITPSATLESWIAYFTEPYKIPLIYCPSAVLAANAYPYLDSNQIKGMLNGVVGASQYEVLLGQTNLPTKAGAVSLSLSLAHILILTFILIGNIAFFLEKRRAK